MLAHLKICVRAILLFLFSFTELYLRLSTFGFDRARFLLIGILLVSFPEGLPVVNRALRLYNDGKCVSYSG